VAERSRKSGGEKGIQASRGLVACTLSLQKQGKKMQDRAGPSARTGLKNVQRQVRETLPNSLNGMKNTQGINELRGLKIIKKREDINDGRNVCRGVRRR